MATASVLGYQFSNGCRIIHGEGANIKKPFKEIPVVMHSFTLKSTKSFSGPIGFIEFTTDIRLPRHIHMDLERKRLIDERIMVLNGVGLVEIAGDYFVIAPGSLVDAVGGVPHTWTACPAGVRLPDGTLSDGKFTMVFEYEDTTTFFPTASTKVIIDAAEYKEFEGSLEEIKIPLFTPEDVVDRAQIIFNREKLGLKLP